MALVRVLYSGLRQPGGARPSRPVGSFYLGVDQEVGGCSFGFAAYLGAS